MQDDARRLKLVRSIIDNPKEFEGRALPAPETLVGKNAGPTGSVLMIDANQGDFLVFALQRTSLTLSRVVWDVQQAVDYVAQLAEFKPWFIEEPTAPVR